MIAKKARFHIVELNASDTRNKASIQAVLGDLSQSNSLPAMAGKRETMILMDEVDGASSSDTGGLAALIKIIGVTKMPIVCIANDIGDRKIQGLKKMSLDLRFSPPSSQDLTTCLSNIMLAENLHMEKIMIEMVGRANGNDIRQVINTF